MSPKHDHSQKFLNAFLNDAQLQTLMRALGSDAGQVRVIGGAVRNALRNVAVNDFDVATIHLPEEVVSRAVKAGFRTIPTGIEHGTVTVVGKEFTCEVTTLREDVETDGRHAIVRFGSSWLRDAERRDFTMNALSVDSAGTLYDLVSGLEDCLSGRVRFIGNARLRIEEDALRALRFFRFSALFGDGELDSDGVRAAVDAADQMSHLSVERIGQEFRKLFAAPDQNQLCVSLQAARPLLKELGIRVEQADILPLAECDRPQWLLRFFLLMMRQSDQLQACAKALKFSNVEAGYIQALVGVLNVLEQNSIADINDMKQLAYRYGKQIVDDAVYLVSRSLDDPAASYAAVAKKLHDWSVPEFPICGADLLAEGFTPGPALGKELSSLEDKWLRERFEPSRSELLSVARLDLQNRAGDK
ncbi:MAG: CCA tRNA nucleotidyltransferase [Hyphomicrobiales bacterium]